MDHRKAHVLPGILCATAPQPRTWNQPNSLTCKLVGMPNNHAFVIRKQGVHLVVRSDGAEVALELMDTSAGNKRALTQIVNCERFLARCFLKQHRSFNHLPALLGYFQDRGWEIGTR